MTAVVSGRRTSDVANDKSNAGAEGREHMQGMKRSRRRV